MLFKQLRYPKQLCSQSLPEFLSFARATEEPTCNTPVDDPPVRSDWDTAAKYWAVGCSTEPPGKNFMVPVPLGESKTLLVPCWFMPPGLVDAMENI